jgi:hypothetical protein
MAEKDHHPKQQMENNRTDGKEQGCRNNNNKKQRFKPFKKRNPDAVPILKFGPSNNFMKFKDALSKKALEECGALGKCIKKGEIEGLAEPDRTE